jgi:hypothetical protein
VKRRRKTPKVVPPPKTRQELEAEFGQVWDAAQLASTFVITAIIGDVVVVRRKADNRVGRLRFQTKPLFYFDVSEAPATEGEE